MDILSNRVPHLQHQLEQMFAKRFSTSAKLKRVAGRRIAQGLGAICKIVEMDLQWDTRSATSVRLPRSVVVKLIDLDEPSAFLTRMNEVIPKTKAIQYTLRMHRGECDFYEFFADKQPDVPVPDFYGFLEDVDGSRMMVLENIGTRGCIVNDISTSLSVEQIHDVTDVLIRFHAWCLNTQVTWQEHFPSWFEKFSMQQSKFQKLLLAELLHLKKDFPKCAVVSEQVIEEFFEENHIRQWHETTDHIMPQVLVHGDLWTNNIMFNRNENGVAGKDTLALLDWQLTYKGAMMQDLAHFLCFAVSAELRRQTETTILEYYYTDLRNRLNNNDSISLASVKRQYERCFREIAYLFISWLPAFFGTVVKTDVADKEKRVEEMVDRALAAYLDATQSDC